MSLRKKIVMIAIFIASVITVSLYFALSSLIINGFNQIEDRIVEKNASRLAYSIDEYFSYLIAKSADWAHWDETYRFVDDKNEKFIKENIVTDAFFSLDINGIIIFNKEGRVVIAQGADLEKRQDQPPSKELLDQLSSDPFLFKKYEDLKPKYGFIIIPDTAPVFVVMHPIVRSDASGPINGTLVFVRYLDESIMNRLTESALFPLSLKLNNSKLTGDFQKAAEEIAQNNTQFVIFRKSDNTYAYTSFKDINNKSAFLFQVTIPRDIHHQAAITLTYLLWSLILCGLLFSITLFFFVEKVILHRLITLSEEVKKISKDNYENTKISLTGNDEISFLSKEIKNMLVRLVQSQQELQKSEERYRAIIESQREFIIRVNREGTCVFANDAFCLKFEQQKSQLIGKKFEPNVHKEDKHLTTKAMKSLDKPPYRTNFEHRMMTKTGWRWIAWEIYAIKDKKNTTTEIQAVGRDITASKDDALALEERAQELERMNKLMVDRELKMTELKEELKKLKNQ